VANVVSNCTAMNLFGKAEVSKDELDSHFVDSDSRSDHPPDRLASAGTILTALTDMSSIVSVVRIDTVPAARTGIS